MKSLPLFPGTLRQWLSLIVRWSLLLGIFTTALRMMRVPGRSHSGPLPPLSADEQQLAGRLKHHVDVLAGEIGERNVWLPDELGKAERYIRETLTACGYAVSAQEYRADGLPVRNLEAASGSSPGAGILIVGAHYDSVVGSPGANDNASGVAALLEMARALAGRSFVRTVRFVAFVNEEPPFFQTESMGSRVYASRCRHRGERIVGMLSLETIGYYADGPGSQRYPFPFNLFYPDTGNFVGFVSNVSSRRLLRDAVSAFRRHAAFPSEGAAAPGWLTGIGWSDHWAFWKEGCPALMVTDTALFRYPCYHARDDTPEKIDYDRLARVVTGLTHAVADLAGP